MTLDDGLAALQSEERKSLQQFKGHLGELLALRSLKLKSYGSRSIDDAFDFYRCIADDHRDASIKSKPIRGLLEVAGERALQNIMIFEGGNRFELSLPVVYGAGNRKPIRGRARSLFAACFADVRVRGRSSVLEFEDALALDFEEDELASIDDNLEYDPAIFRTCDRDGWVIDNTRAVPDIELDEAMTLVGTHSWEFGHWFSEYLAKYLMAAAACDLEHVPILIDAGMPEQHKEALRLLASPAARLIELEFGQSARVRRLWCAPSPYYSPRWVEMNEKFSWGTHSPYPPTFAPLMSEMARRLEPVGSNAGGPRRIFLSRKPGQHRQLRNGQEIESIARSRGFEIVYPQDLSFREQAQLVQNADFILGLFGSACYLSYISKPGAKVLILNHPYTLEASLTITPTIEARGIRAAILIGPNVNLHPIYPHFSDFEIPAPEFVRRLDEWLEENAIGA